MKKVKRDENSKKEEQNFIPVLIIKFIEKNNNFSMAPFGWSDLK